MRHSLIRLSNRHHALHQWYHLDVYIRYDTGLRSPNKRIDKLNNLLSTSSYLVPDGGFSLADVAVASYLLYVVQFFPDIELYSKWPHVVRYMKECAGRENYEKAFGSNVQKFLLSRLEEMETAGDDNKKGKKVFGMFWVEDDA
jgi:glutathione S-transferase